MTGTRNRYSWLLSILFRVTLYHLLTGDDSAHRPVQFPTLATLPFALRELLAVTLIPDPQDLIPAELEARLTATQLP